MHDASGGDAGSKGSCCGLLLHDELRKGEVFEEDVHEDTNIVARETIWDDEDGGELVKVSTRDA